MADTSEAVPFDRIPVSLLIPGTRVEVDNSRAYAGLYGLPTKLLIIGQVLASAGIQRGIPVRISRATEAPSLCGAGSMLAQMAARAMASTEGWIPTYLLALDDLPAGVAATGTLTVGGTATASGTLALYIAGRRLTVGVFVGDTAAVIAANIQAALLAETDLPVTTTISGSVITLSARHKGECGNTVDVRHSYWPGEALPAGMALTVVALAGGTGNPLVQSALDALGPQWFTDIALPYTDQVNYNAIHNNLYADFGPMTMHHGMVWAAARGSFGALTTLGDSRNSPHVSITGYKSSPTPVWEWAAAIAGISAYELNNDPARPLQFLALPGVLPPPVWDQFSDQERNQLLREGISTWKANATSTGVLTEYLATNHTRTDAGDDDPTYRDVETMRTLAFLVHDLQIDINRTFPRFKLADDGTEFAPGSNIVTPRTIGAHFVARFQLWEQQGLVEGREQFKQDLRVVRDPNNPNRVNALLRPDLINRLRITAIKLQFWE